MPPHWRHLDNILSHILELKSPRGGRNQQHAVHKHIDPILVGARRLMMLTPDYFTNQKNVQELITHSITLSLTLSLKYLSIKGGVLAF